MAVSLLVIDQEACHKAGSGYQVVAGIEGMASVQRLPTMQVKLLAVVVRSSLRVLDWYDSGRLVREGLGIGVSEV